MTREEAKEIADKIFKDLLNNKADELKNYTDETWGEVEIPELDKKTIKSIYTDGLMLGFYQGFSEALKARSEGVHDELIKKIRELEAEVEDFKKTNRELAIECIELKQYIAENE